MDKDVYWAAYWASNKKAPLTRDQQIELMKTSNQRREKTIERWKQVWRKIMRIESVQVIPSTKESKFEDIEYEFEVAAMTTSFDEWETFMIKKINTENTEAYRVVYDDQCKNFALKHQAFMTAPVAKFGSVYSAKTRLIEIEYLDGIPPLGPLYSVYKTKVEDRDAGKTVFRKYLNPETFKEETGMWYPHKDVCVVRYGKSQ